MLNSTIPSADRISLPIITVGVCALSSIITGHRDLLFFKKFDEPSHLLKKSRPMIMDDSAPTSREGNSFENKMCSLKNYLWLLKYVGETYS